MIKYTISPEEIIGTTSQQQQKTYKEIMDLLNSQKFHEHVKEFYEKEI